MVKITKARPADVPALLRLIEAYWDFECLGGFDGARLQPLLERMLAEPQLGAILIAKAETNAVGYLVLSYSLSLEFKGMVAEIDEFFVSAETRGHGAGQRLLAAAERECAHAGCTRLSLRVAAQNEAAQRFYGRHGFESRGGYRLVDKAIVGSP